MSVKSTIELAVILGITHFSEFDQYCKDHKESMKAGKDMFSIYIKNILSEKGIVRIAHFHSAFFVHNCEGVAARPASCASVLYYLR